MRYSKQAKAGFLFYIGFVTYITIEVIFRGYSHWAMGIVGGICFLIIGKINEKCAWNMDLLVQMVIAALVVTLVEFAAGLILNVWLGLGIWDYSELKYNVMGQISLLFTICWLPLSLIGIFLDDWLRHFLFGERVPCYKIAGIRFGYARTKRNRLKKLR